MDVTVNGRPVELDDATSMSDLISGYGLQLGSVVVEHNGKALVRTEVTGAVLADGDRVELVRAVAGG